MAMDYEHVRGPGQPPAWTSWPVYWSAIWVGALTATVVALIIGLIAIAVGAHQLGPAHRLVSWHSFGIGALVFGILGAFFSYVAGGWVAGRIAGIRWAEHAMLHGGIVWLVTIPAALFFAALGAGDMMGAWGAGLVGTPAWVTTTAAGAAADPTAATIARNEALGALVGILVGLIGAVIGGWMASGEPMSLKYKRDADREHTAGLPYHEHEYVGTGSASTTTVRVKPVETP